jgi:hypothetical protein
MGCFSWWTTTYGGHLSRPIYMARKKLPVIDVWMHTPDGKSYYEAKYRWYGEFGGKDYFVALSKCNPEGGTEQLTQQQHRVRGLELEFENSRMLRLQFPVFTETDTYDGSFDQQCKRSAKQGLEWEKKDPTRNVNSWCTKELKGEYIELEEDCEVLEECLEKERAESKRLRDCLRQYTDDKEQLTGKKKRS